MAHALLYAAGAAIVGGVGYAIYRHFRGPCPSKSEMAAIIGDIDSGKIDRVEANGIVARFDSQGCAKEAAAVRKLLAAKDSRGDLGGLVVDVRAEWPDTDAKCKAAIDALPHERETSGSLVSSESYYEIARNAAATSKATSDPRALYAAADALYAAEAMVMAGGYDPASAKAAGIYRDAAICLRDRATVVSKFAGAHTAGTRPTSGVVGGIGSVGGGAMRPMWTLGRWRWSRA